MICPKCGTQNDDNAKFCTNCGTVLSAKSGVKTVRLKCKNCDGIMQADKKNNILICPFCGSKELIVDSEAVALEKVRSAQKLEREKRASEEEAARSFEKSIFRRVLIVFAFFSLMFSAMGFTSRSFICGIIALVQMILNLLAWMIGMRIIKARARHLPRALFLIGLFLIIPFLLFFDSPGSSRVSRSSSYEWGSTALTKLIEKPASEKGEVITSSDTLLSAYISDMTSAQYKDYVSSCIDRGFDQDPVREGNSYIAFDQNGTKLDLDYYESTKEMALRMNAPLTLMSLQWPTSGPAAMLPKPDASTGLIEWESDYGINVYVGETARTDYATYVQRCIDAGFNVDYSRGTDYFYGDNDAGDHLSLNYYGFNIMEIRLHKARK